jgi:N-acetylmuramoyl-L-alanine amidase
MVRRSANFASITQLMENSPVGRVWLAAKIAFLGTLGGLGWVSGRALHAESARWPDRVELTLLPPPVAGPKLRVVIDPGHGARDNTGNRSSYCKDEQDFTLELARDVRTALEDTGRFEVRLTREAGSTVEYRARLSDAESWGARAFVSLHSDVRGHAESWKPTPVLECPRRRGGNGFAVLFSDESSADAELTESLASCIASEVTAAGFVPFGGIEYSADYQARRQAGVFADRHAPGERIFVLRASSVPSVIVETHNALDDREARAWEQPATRRAFGRALARALASSL